ncbi:MAG: hypothetical protein RLZ55_738, partial [Actinomycetota bacterium]
MPIAAPARRAAPRRRVVARRGRPRNIVGGLGVAALLVGLFVLLLFRRDQSLYAPSVWAEDGAVFLTYAGRPDALLETYRGQLWLGHRLTAGVVHDLPITWWPVAMYAASCAVVLGSMSVVLLRRAAPVFGPLVVRAGILALLVLAPGMQEVQGNVTNSHWAMALSVAMLLAMPAPRLTWGRWAEGAWLVVAGLTGITAVLVAPVALWSLVHARKERASYVRWRAIGVLGLAAVNLILLALVVDEDRPDGGVWLGNSSYVLPTLAKRVGASLVIGVQGVADSLHWPSMPPVWVGVGAVMLAGLLGLAVIDFRGPSPWWLVSGVLSVFLALVTMTPAGAAVVQDALPSSRYVVLGILGAILVIGRAIGTGGHGQVVTASILLAAVMVSSVVDYHIDGWAPIDPIALQEFSDCVAADRPGCNIHVAPMWGD